MSWKYVKEAVNVGCYTLSGVSLYYLVNREKFKTVHNSAATAEESSYTKWDNNWDCRGSRYLLPEHNGLHKSNEKSHPKATRHLILIRHGQYNLDGATDKERILTELGRKQAKMTGDRLKELKIPINDFVISTMCRAQETGKIILGQLDRMDNMKIENCSLLEEGAPPSPPEPKVGSFKPQKYFFVDGSRIEAGFRKYFYRADLLQKDDSYTVLVCHANVIRYFVCRALQVDPAAWLRFSLHHASITWLSIYPSGRVVLRLFGDCGHIEKKHLSTKHEVWTGNKPIGMQNRILYDFHYNPVA